MHIVADRTEIARRRRIHHQRLVAPTEQVTEELMPSVEPGGVGAQKPRHARDQVSLGRLDHQMKMISHQAEGVDLPIRFGAGLTQGFKKPFPIPVIVEDGFAPVPAIHHMVDCAFVFNTQMARHARGIQQTCKLSIVRSDP